LSTMMDVDHFVDEIGPSCFCFQHVEEMRHIAVVVNPSKSRWNASRTNNQQQLLNIFEFKNSIRRKLLGKLPGKERGRVEGKDVWKTVRCH